MAQSINYRFLLLKSLCKSFSTSAEAIGGGFSSLVVDMGDGTIAKVYQHNRYNTERNLRSLQNEAQILKAFNGQVGQFSAPTLITDPIIFEEGDPVSAHFIGFIPMTKLEGRTVEWPKLSEQITPHNFKIHLRQVGSLIASVHDTAEKHGLNFFATSKPPQMAAPWTAELEIAQTVQACDQWLTENQRAGFAHADIAGQNIVIDKDNNITGILDFSFSGVYCNQMVDFRDMSGDFLSLAKEGYESTSDKEIDIAVVEMTQVQTLAGHISHLIQDSGPEEELKECKKDFENWIQSIAKDLALQ